MERMALGAPPHPSRWPPRPISAGRCNTPSVLVVDHDPSFRRAARRLLASAVPVLLAESCGAAEVLLRRGVDVCALVVEAEVRGGAVFAWLASLRRSGVQAPVLVLSSTCDAAAANEALTLGAHFACKPLPAKALRAFAIQAAVRAQSQGRQ